MVGRVIASEYLAGARLAGTDCTLISEAEERGFVSVGELWVAG